MIKFKNKNGDRIIAIMDNDDQEPVFVEKLILTTEDIKETEEEKDVK